MGVWLHTCTKHMVHFCLVWLLANLGSMRPLLTCSQQPDKAGMYHVFWVHVCCNLCQWSQQCTGQEGTSPVAGYRWHESGRMWCSRYPECCGPVEDVLGMFWNNVHPVGRIAWKLNIGSQNPASKLSPDQECCAAMCVT